MNTGEITKLLHVYVCVLTRPHSIASLTKSSHYTGGGGGASINSVEITGITGNIENADLENEVIKVFNKAKVVVNGVKLDKAQIQGCHRVGKKGKVILKTLKYAVESLYCSKNLKGNSPYDTPVFINNFC